jgi:hypothetical protein
VASRGVWALEGGGYVDSRGPVRPILVTVAEPGFPSFHFTASQLEEWIEETMAEFRRLHIDPELMGVWADCHRELAPTTLRIAYAQRHMLN